MSKGNPVITFRIDRFQEQRMRHAIDRRNFFTKEKPWGTADFIRCAIEDKLKHMERSRKAKKRKAATSA